MHALPCPLDPADLLHKQPHRCPGHHLQVLTNLDGASLLILHPPYVNSLINRPGVAGAVLQISLSLIYSVILLFKYLENIITSIPLELGTWNCETMFFTPCVSYVTYHVSCVTCHVSCVTCHTSGVTWHQNSLKKSYAIRARDLIFTDNVHHFLCVMCHMPCDTCQVSGVNQTCKMLGFLWDPC